MALPQAIFLMGPTGTGKTELGMALADELPCRLISVDSAMVYRGLDVGSAKPDRATLQRYPHALVDICEPTEVYSVARFLEDAGRELALAQEEGRIPLFVGGTMLYFKALREGLSNLPAADASIRRALEARAEEEGWPALHAELRRVDPLTAERLHPNHSVRIQRALEVWMQTGTPLSRWHQQSGQGGILDRVRATQLALVPSQREALHARLELRLQKMLDAGLVEEVRGLYRRGDLSAQLPAMRAVGYRQVWAFLQGELGEEDLHGAILAATRQLAKRQLTWLRSWPEVRVVDPLGEPEEWKSSAELARECLKFL